MTTRTPNANARLAEQVVQAAKLWLHTHPGAGAGYDRAHDAATEQLLGAVRALNRSEAGLLPPEASAARTDLRLLNELRDAAHHNARAHGFHDQKRTVGDGLMLIVTEASEAYEAFREGAAPAAFLYEEKVPVFRETGKPLVDDAGKHVQVAVARSSFYPKLEDGTDDTSRPFKPIGVPSEIADLVIRIFDFAGEHGIDLERAVTEKMAYNKTRPFRHGNKAL